MLTRSDIDDLKRSFVPAGEATGADVPPDEDWQPPSEIPEGTGGEPEQPADDPAKQAKGRRLTFTRFSQVMLGTAARYLVKGLIPSVGMVVVWGPPKCGKSFFVFDMVAHAAAGWKYRGRKVQQCPVVYFALEGQEGFTARVEAFRLEHGAPDIPFYLSADRIV